ncbi:HET-domain-containing protein, partial [Cryphonectria parasitica EP155]
MDPSDPAASLERPPRTSALPQYYRKLCRPKQIRVVSISPGQWKDPIRCRLLHYELSELHEADSCYKALSYVWGSSVVKDIIYVEDISRVGNIVRIEDHPVEITFNLFCALRYLRHTDHDVVLWVDALCINQEDDKERSHQVSLMRQIYEQAKEVIVFMGDGRSHRIQRLDLTEPPMCPKRQIYGGYKDDAFLDEFLETCRSAKLKVLRSPASAGLCAMGLVRLFSAEDKNEYCREIMSLREPVRRHLFECLKCFLVCPWWKRIWVVQEVAVSKKVIVQYGTVSACWEIFVGATNFISSHHKRTTALAELEPENLKVLDLLNSQLSNLERTRQRWHEEGGTHLVHLLQEFSNREATDDRDKVYGLLSLAKWEHGISPDYTLDVFQVYRNTFLGRNAAGPDLACWAGDQKRKNRRDLPSWIPDWSHGLDIADRRRMTLLDTYKAKTGWTLKVIHEEQE